MALMLEIRDARGHTTWRRLDGHPLSLGRGLSNDVILDDPYVDGRHASITRDGSGAWTIADLGSVNGLYANGARTAAPTVVGAGTEVRIGRTVLRFRDADAPVPAALVDDQTPVVAAPAAVPAATPVEASVDSDAPTGRPRAVAAVLDTTRGRLVVVGAMLAAFTLNAWLSDTTRSPGSSVFALVMSLGAFVSVWAVAWAAATRRADRKFHFLGHLAVAGAALLVALIVTELKEWLSFLFPGATIVALFYVAAYLALAAAVVAEHLGVAGTMPARRRWRAGLLVSGAILMLTVLAVLVKDETFSDTPRFESGLKPLAPTFVPTASIDDFSAVMRKAKREADDAAKKEVDP